MKEIIVIFATIVLGIAIAGFVMQLKEPSSGITKSITNQMDTLVTNGGSK